MLFTLTNQANVLITTDAQDPGVPDLGDDTYLYLYDSDLSLISFNDDGNAFYFSAIYETGLVAGTYYIAVEGFDLYTTTNRWYTLTYDAYPAQTVITNFAVAGSNRFEIGWPGDSVFTYDILTRSNAWAEWVFKTNVPGSIGANAVEFQDDDDQKWYRVRTK